jgi:ABC-type sugar transport system permease subunit
MTTPAGIAATGAAETRALRPRARSLKDRGVIVLAVPSLIWYAIFTVGPLFAMFYIAFLDWRGLASQPEWAGLANFELMFRDPRVSTALVNTFVHLLCTLPAMMVGSFMIGYFLNLKLPGHRALRVIMFIPALISVSALGMLFVAVLGPVGMVNSVLAQLGFAELANAWLANAQTAMACLILISIWSGMGFNSVLFAARLSAIDDEIYNAAELDGANHWQKMWRVAFPMCEDYFGVITMLQYLWTLFGTAGLILILTNGGPGQATSTLSWLVYKFGYESSRVGYSQAIGILLFVLGIIGLVIIRRIFRSRF